jgi:hypothetical protein
MRHTHARCVSKVCRKTGRSKSISIFFFPLRVETVVSGRSSPYPQAADAQETGKRQPVSQNGPPVLSSSQRTAHQPTFSGPTNTVQQQSTPGPHRLAEPGAQILRGVAGRAASGNDWPANPASRVCARSIHCSNRKKISSVDRRLRLRGEEGSRTVEHCRRRLLATHGDFYCCWCCSALPQPAISRRGKPPRLEQEPSRTFARV